MYCCSHEGNIPQLLLAFCNFTPKHSYPMLTVVRGIVLNKITCILNIQSVCNIKDTDINTHIELFLPESFVYVSLILGSLCKDSQTCFRSILFLQTAKVKCKSGVF